jgi:hypothetical protein
MTLEEAVEIVLGPHEWVPCPHCSRGYTTPRHATLGEVVNEDDRCHICDGSGGVLNDRHTLAHLLTDTPHPSPWTMKKLASGIVHLSGPAVYVGKMPIKPRLWLITDGSVDLVKEVEKL